MAAIDHALDANNRYADGFRKGSLPMPPRRKLAIVVCMDARIDPAKALGLEEGDAHVIRNAGGRIADAVRSLAISQALLGTEEVMIVHHTDCGMLTFTDDSLRAQLRERGVDADDVAFLPFKDVEESVRADLDAYERSPLVRHDVPVRGFVYDVKTGRVHEVERTVRARTAGA
ncbi:MAG: carbonic anhydrase [Acidobacteria bacterium]|nr:MAG: carbonic anhydrase [Acidobacteriota bacterium]